MKNMIWAIMFSLMTIVSSGCGKGSGGEEPTPQENGGRQVSDIWVRPEEGVKGNPCWGFKDGMQIGIAPLGGPRGLIRIYAPYAQQSAFKPFNFIAFEPINSGGARGLSELEQSKLDKVQGMRFWSGNSENSSEFPDPTYPAAGKVYWVNEIEKLSVYIFCEQFANGAYVYVKATFTAGRPYEVELTTYRMSSSGAVKNFVLSATMGNYARLRQLHLNNNVVRTAPQIWPSYTGVDFTGRYEVKQGDMITDGRNAKWFIASPSEDKPWEANYAPGTANNWIYQGQTYITQYWMCPDPQSSLSGWVNGRYCYWKSQSPIPGGIAFENYEFIEGFRVGARYVFGLYPGKPNELIKKISRAEYP